MCFINKFNDGDFIWVFQMNNSIHNRECFNLSLNNEGEMHNEIPRKSCPPKLKEGKDKLRRSSFWKSGKAVEIHS